MGENPLNRSASISINRDDDIVSTFRESLKKFIRELHELANRVKISGNLDTREGRDALPIIQSMIPWTERIYDMTPQEISDYKAAYHDEYHNSEEKRTREVVDIFYMEYQYFQVRKTYDWVLDQFKLSGDKMAIRREILLQRLRGSNASPFNPEDIEYLISNMKKSTKDLLICGKWLFRLYDHDAGLQFGRPKDLDEDIPYLVGIDPAGGGGGDNFSVTIVNPYNLKIAAEFKSPYISGPNAVRMILELVNDHIPNAVLIPEKNSMGIYLLQMLLETSVRDNIYWSESAKQLEEMTEESSSDYELKSISAKYKKYGTYTSSKVRAAMFELLFQHVDLHKELLNTEYLVDDMCKLIKTSTGRIEADKGEHDDCIMSYLHAIYIYYTGDNLIHFGIDKTLHPISNTNSTIELDTDEKVLERDEMRNYFIENNYKSYNEEVMEDAARVEMETKDLVNTFNFIHDGVYSRIRDNSSQDEENVSIHASFFDAINN